MKKILSLIILFFFLNNCSESYNKSTLRMNGVTLGESLLYYLDEKQIKTLQLDWKAPKKNNKIKTIVLDRDKMDVKKHLTELTYDIFKNPEIDFKNDSSYKILGIRGKISCEEMQSCLELFSFALSETAKKFPRASRVDREDQTGIPGKVSKVRTFFLKDAQIRFWLFNIPGDKEFNKTYIMKSLISDEIREYK